MNLHISSKVFGVLAVCLLAIVGAHRVGISTDPLGAAAGSLTGTTMASNVVASSLTSVGTLANLTVTNPITGSVTGAAGSVSGNATTATALQTARTINGVSFDGTANISISAAASAEALTGTTIASNVTGSSLTSVGTLANLTVTNPITGSVSGSSGSATGNAATATALQTARAINGVNFDGTGPITITAAAGTLTGATLASGVTASSLTSLGTLGSLTVTNPITGSVSGSAATLTTARLLNNTSFNGSAAITIYPPTNASTADQTINATTTTLLAGSTIAVPSTKMKVGTVFRYTIALSKTGAGTAANSFLWKAGTAGTSSDATILTFALPVGTAVIDVGLIDIVVTIRGPLSSSCIAQGQLRMTHNLAATGLATIPSVNINVTSSTWDCTTANLIANVTATTAASTVLTFQQVNAEALNL